MARFKIINELQQLDDKVITAQLKMSGDELALFVNGVCIIYIEPEGRLRLYSNDLNKGVNDYTFNIKDWILNR
jgi:hypothetical protein